VILLTIVNITAQKINMILNKFALRIKINVDLRFSMFRLHKGLR